MNNLNWSFSKIWNESLEFRKDRELKPRSNIWASELGGAYIDRFLKMRAIPFTNPPNARSLRKFEAGNMMEWVVGLVLRRAGVLIEAQEWVEHTYPGLLRVSGKLDFLAGGQPDWEKAKAEITSLMLPEFFNRATGRIIEYLSTTYPNGLEKIVLEIKSCSFFMFERYEKVGADPHHALQAFHYLKAKDMPEAHLIYISRDDLRLLEIGIFNPSPTEELYKADIERMTEVFKSNQQPEKEPLVVFDALSGKFSRNWKVAYSNYLTMLYGYEDQFAYEAEWVGKVNRWNRVLARCVNGDKMTEKNLEIIEEIKETFPEFDQIVAEAKAKGITLEEIPEENE